MAIYLKSKTGDLLLNPDGDKLLVLQEQVSFNATIEGTYTLPLPNGKEISVIAFKTKDSMESMNYELSADFELIFTAHGYAWKTGNDFPFSVYKSVYGSLDGVTLTLYDADRYEDDALNDCLSAGEYELAAFYLGMYYTPIAKLKLANNQWTIQDKTGKDWYGFVNYTSYNSYSSYNG